MLHYVSAHWCSLVFYWCSSMLLDVLLMFVSTPWSFVGFSQCFLLWSVGVHWHFGVLHYDLLVLISVPCWSLLYVGVHQHASILHYALLVFIGVPCWNLLSVGVHWHKSVLCCVLLVFIVEVYLCSSMLFVVLCWCLLVSRLVFPSYLFFASVQVCKLEIRSFFFNCILKVFKFLFFAFVFWNVSFLIKFFHFCSIEMRVFRFSNLKKL